MQITWITTASWALVALGVLHILLSFVRFRQPFAAALSEGLINKFRVDDARRVAFWFAYFGPVLTLCGHIAVRAAAASDVELIKIIGIYLCATSILGVIAFPKSPIWMLLIVSTVLIAVGYGWLV